MSHYDDFRRSTGTFVPETDRWDADRFSRERRDRLHPRGPPVAERPRRVDDERFEWRLQEDDRYPPPARRPGRHYDDDHLSHPAGPMVAFERRRGESPPPRPRLLRRQSSLDTFDRARRLDEKYYADYHPRGPPSPPPPRRRGSFRRSRESDFYEDIRIAEPDFYGDEEFRGFRERGRYPPPRPARLVEEEIIEKPYPRKGKTRMPRKLIHTHAVREVGYPYHEEGDMIIIELALSKEQIDHVIGRSREIKRRSERHIIHSPSPVRDRLADRTERLALERSPRHSNHDMLIVEPSPSRHRSHSRHNHHHHSHGYPHALHHHHTHDMTERKVNRTFTRARSISVHGRPRRRSSPVRMFDRHDGESDKLRTGPMAVMIRPRDSDEKLREYLDLERRHRPDEVSRTRLMLGNGEEEEITETKRDRTGPNSRVLRAMMATLT